MPSAKLALARPESLLLTACDDPRAILLDSIEYVFAGQGLLNRYQVHGAFANDFESLEEDA